MVTIYHISNGYLGASREVADDGQIPAGWTRSVPPALTAGEYAAWAGRWVKTTRPPEPRGARLPMPDKALTLTRQEFLDLFTTQEQAAIMQAQGSDPLIAAWLLRLQVVAEVILSDPRTVDGVQALADGGLLAQERVADVLAGVRP
ncbi:MAG: hypothetical protein H5T76_24570 [Streptomyces sp.]|nr:hypothetical protein [Streptomyces sp.]